MNGIIVVNKHENVTSRDIVNDICHIFHTKSVGHTGTLDPLATGVLVITLGKYTKLNDVLTSKYKEYIAEMKLGITTDTLDITGNILEEKDVVLNDKEIRDTINSYVKTYDQEVPIFSAVKVNGKKLYEYAREGISVELPKKSVTISSIEILDINNNVVKFKCLVSKGTYIRSLIRDIGTSLGCGATMTSLTRTKQAGFDISESYTIESIREGNYRLLDIEEFLDLEVINCDDELYKKIVNGVKLNNNYNKPFLLFKYNNDNISLYKKDDNNIYRMFIKY